MADGNYFALLGLAPGNYSEQQLADRLSAIRADVADENLVADATLAYCVLRDPDRQQKYLDRLATGQPRPLVADPPPACPPDATASSAAGPPAPVNDEAAIEAALSAAVAALLEGDSHLLRYSNRRRLLDLAGRLGLSAFEANLLIERARYRAIQRSAPRAAGDASQPGGATPTREPLTPAEESGSPAERVQVAPGVLPPGRARKLARWLIAIGLALLLDAVLLALLRPR